MTPPVQKGKFAQAREWLLGRYPRFRSFTNVAAGSVLAQGITVISLPLLTRLYAPEEFGSYFVYTSLVLISAAIAPLGLDKLISRLEDEAECTAAMMVGFGACLAASPLLVGIQYAALPAGLMGGVRGDLLIVGAFLSAAQRLAQVWLVRTGRAGIVPFVTGVTTVSMMLTAIALSPRFLDTGFGLQSSLCYGNMAGLLCFFSICASGFGREAAKAAWAVKRAVGRYRVFSLFGTISVTLNTLGAWLGILLIAHIYGSHAAGVSALAMRCIGLPARLIAGAAAQVHMMSVADFRMRSGEQLISYYEKFAKDLRVAGTILIGSISAVLAPNMQTIFGQEWIGAGSALLCLTPLFIAQFAVTALTETALLVDRYALQMVADGARLVLVVLGFLIPEAAGAQFLAGLAGYSAAMTCAYGLYYFLGRAALIGLQEEEPRIAVENGVRP